MLIAICAIQWFITPLKVHYCIIFTFQIETAYYELWFDRSSSQSVVRSLVGFFFCCRDQYVGVEDENSSSIYIIAIVIANQIRETLHMRMRMKRFTNDTK